MSEIYKYRYIHLEPDAGSYTTVEAGSSLRLLTDPRYLFKSADQSAGRLSGRLVRNCAFAAGAEPTHVRIYRAQDSVVNDVNGQAYDAETWQISSVALGEVDLQALLGDHDRGLLIPERVLEALLQANALPSKQREKIETALQGNLDDTHLRFVTPVVVAERSIWWEEREPNLISEFEVPSTRLVPYHRVGRRTVIVPDFFGGPPIEPQAGDLQYFDDIITMPLTDGGNGFILNSFSLVQPLTDAGTPFLPEHEYPLQALPVGFFKPANNNSATPDDFTKLAAVAEAAGATAWAKIAASGNPQARGDRPEPPKGKAGPAGLAQD